jgi:hypothetical protein
MATFTRSFDATAVAAVTMHAGDPKAAGSHGHKRLHLAGVAEKDGKGLTIGSTDEAVVSGKVFRIPFDAAAGIWTVDLDAKQKGKATLQARVNGKTVAELPVTVEDRLQLPAASSPQGMLVRLFLAETASPETGKVKWTVADAKKSMQWMRLVLQNRLDHNPAQFMAKGATTLQDIVTAKDNGVVQFEGFSKYPAVDAAINQRVNEAFKIANDDSDRRQDDYAAFVRSALDVAADKGVIQDPSGGEHFLSGWMTVNHSPGDDSIPFQAIMDNQFFMMKRPK